VEHVELETYRRVFFSSPEFVSISRLRDSVYVDVNPGFERFTGYRREEVLGRSAFELGIWPDAAERERMITALARQGQLHLFPTRLRNRAGMICDVELSASVARIHDERFLVTVVRDITERKRTEDELRLYRDKLEYLIEERTAELRQSNSELQETNLQLEEAHRRLMETEKRMRHMALHDLLTGLPNRALLQDRVTQAISHARRERKRAAILFIDLDNFKHINDSLGHLVGDRLLQIVAARLHKCVRRGDTVARLGGDEFVMCLGALDDSSGATVVAQKVLASLDSPMIVEGHELHVTGSIGISVYPDDGSNAEILLQASDTAMYHAKGHGRNSFSFFTPELNEAVQQRLTIESQLHQALPRNEFRLHYQPQVDLGSGRVVSAEALLRWQQPQRGMVSPLDFIPVAEENGMILRIGEWVLREACGQLRRWHDAGHRDLSIAVNLSARQVLQPAFAATVASVIAEAGIPPSALVLEITESLLMQPSEDNMAILHRLTASGVRLSLDDFGTGYSSLSYLKRFPIGELKIDRSFVRGIEHDENDRAIAGTVIAMARGLRLTVIAEGVETPGQAAFLRASGCGLAQGYYYGMPMPPVEFAALLARQAAQASTAG
jgi:diguanylate cyclase (GGDEF)-like protein/PAS domain S-box-containing protein